MAGVYCLQRVSLVLHAGPDRSELIQHCHFSMQEFRALGEGVSSSSMGQVVGTVYVYCAGRTDCIADKGGPVQKCCIPSDLDQLCNGIGVQSAQIRSLDLPGLMLTRSRQFGQINGQEGAVDQAVDQVIDELAQHQRRAVMRSEQGVNRREDVLCRGCPVV